jgi:hypothetical protein
VALKPRFADAFDRGRIFSDQDLARSIAIRSRRRAHRECRLVDARTEAEKGVENFSKGPRWLFPV